MRHCAVWVKRVKYIAETSGDDNRTVKFGKVASVKDVFVANGNGRRK